MHEKLTYSHPFVGIAFSSVCHNWISIGPSSGWQRESSVVALINTLHPRLWRTLGAVHKLSFILESTSRISIKRSVLLNVGVQEDSKNFY